MAGTGFRSIHFFLGLGLVGVMSGLVGWLGLESPVLGSHHDDHPLPLPHTLVPLPLHGSLKFKHPDKHASPLKESFYPNTYGKFADQLGWLVEFGVCLGCHSTTGLDLPKKVLRYIGGRSGLKVLIRPHLTPSSQTLLASLIKIVSG